MTDISSLSDYRLLAFRLAGDLETLRGLADDLRLASLVSPIEELLARVRSHIFSVAVVGEFKRGKSTFINALLGHAILPSDIAPASATLNRVTYGREPRVRVFYRDGGSDGGEGEPHEDIPIGQLAEYVTKLTPQAEAIASRIREAVVYYPLPYLQTNNLDFIDTPGLNDELGQTEITMEVLGRVDAAIMVIMATSPFADSERAFLERLLAQGLGRVIFVVTGLDRLASAEQRQRVLQHITSQIGETIRAYAAERHGAGTPEGEAFLRRYGRPVVCGMSGYQALQALQQNSQAGLDESGLPAFSRVLDHYMAYERGAQMLLTQTSQIVKFGEVMLKEIDREAAARRQQQQQTEIAAEVSRALLESLRALGQAELRRLAAATERAKAAAQPLAPVVDKAAREAILNAIGTTPMASASLEAARYDSFAKELGGRLVAASQAAAAANGPRLLQDLMALGRSEKVLDARPLVHFAINLDYTLRFVRAGLGGAAGGGAGGAGAVPSLQASLRRQAGFAPPKAGEAQADLVFFDQAAVTAVLSLPPQLVEAALQAVAQPLAQQRTSMTWQIAESLRVNNYRGLLRRAMLKELDDYYRAAPTLPRLQAQIQTAFEELQKHVTSAINAVQDTLGELRAHGEREAAMAERDLDALQHARQEVQEIIQRATDLQRRSEELLDLADQLSSQDQPAG